MNNNEYRAAYEIPFACFSFFLVTSVLCQSCKEEVTSARSMLVAADSMMWSNPDSALLVLEQIPDSRELRGEERALYALLLTQARYKSCVLLENDSLIQIAVDYYEGGGKQERLAQAYFYWGCVYMENKEFPKAISLYLKSLELMPKKDSIFVAMLYSHWGTVIMSKIYILRQGKCIGRDIIYVQ